MEHHLKTWPDVFAATRFGLKSFDLRINDRDFKVGDYLILEEFEPCPKCGGCGRVSGQQSKYSLMRRTARE